ncbi:MAG: J domain-containing protein [Methylococcales bacterium]
MKKTYSYEECYKILGLTSDCTWNDVRSSYKKLIQKWHPDRFDDKSDEQIAADEKIKNINIAHHHLSSYFRKNKSLPTITPNRNKLKKHHQHNKLNTKFNRPNRPIKTKQHFKEEYKSGKKPVIKTSIAIIVFFIIYYLQSTEQLPAYPEVNLKEVPTPTIKSDKQLDNTNALYKSNTNDENFKESKILADVFFTVGSSMGEVIVAQGAPTTTNDNIWFYGQSEVHFKDGKVARWVRSVETPLHAKLLTNYDFSRH